MKKNKFNILRLIKIIAIELLILALANPIINKIVYNSRMEMGSWSIFAPLPIFTEQHINSLMVGIGFNLLYLVIDVIIILGVGLLVNYIYSKKVNT